MAIVCHCNVVGDATIRDAVLAGAESPDEVADRCGAGAVCGGCVEAVHEVIDQVAARRVAMSPAA